MADLKRIEYVEYGPRKVVGMMNITSFQKREKNAGVQHLMKVCLTDSPKLKIGSAKTLIIMLGLVT